MKDKRSNRYKTAAWILLIAGIVSFSVINIFRCFFTIPTVYIMKFLTVIWSRFPFYLTIL